MTGDPKSEEVRKSRLLTLMAAAVLVILLIIVAGVQVWRKGPRPVTFKQLDTRGEGAGG